MGIADTCTGKWYRKKVELVVRNCEKRPDELRRSEKFWCQRTLFQLGSPHPTKMFSWMTWESYNWDTTAAGKLAAETAFGNRIHAIEVRQFGASSRPSAWILRCKLWFIALSPGYNGHLDFLSIIAKFRLDRGYLAQVLSNQISLADNSKCIVY